MLKVDSCRNIHANHKCVYSVKADALSFKLRGVIAVYNEIANDFTIEMNFFFYFFLIFLLLMVLYSLTMFF